MALTRTTLTGGMTPADIELVLTSIAGLAVGNQIVVDQETMRVLSVGTAATVPVGVIRGIRGSAAVAHPAGAGATFGPPADFAPSRAVAPRNEVVSYSAAGTIANPRPGTNRVAVLNGTTVLAMTIGAPSKENDGDMLIVVSNGKAAHVVTVTGGIGAGGSAVDALTFSATGQNSVVLIAANEVWVPAGSVYSGTLTTVTVTAA